MKTVDTRLHRIDAQAPEFFRLRDNWGWFLAEGILLSIIGIIALSTAALTTVASIFFLGWLLLIAGIAHAVHSFFTGSWGGFFAELLGGILYGVAGILMVANPGATAVTLTLMVTPLFMIAGIFRMVSAAIYRYPQWGWAFASGALTLFAGIMVWQSMPVSGLWLIGTLIGIELLFRGIALSIFAAKLRSLRGTGTPFRAAA